MSIKLYAIAQFYDNVNNDYKLIYINENLKKVKKKMSFLIETNGGKNKRYKIMVLS